MTVTPCTLAEAERVARQRAQRRDRKRAERERLAEAGRPLPTAVERAVVDALRTCLLAAQPGQRLETPILPTVLLKVAGQLLRRRVLEAHEAGAEPLVYTAAGVSAALQARLLTPPRRPAKPAKTA